MNIAFDAKRAFQNNTGLGNYSRTLISSLATFYPQHHYYLYAPKQTDMYANIYPNMDTVLPEKRLHRWFRGAWRSKYVVGELAEKKIDIYHGLSHEIPFGIHKSGVKSVVTMHDLIFERYPGQYNPIDVQMYRRKAKYAAQYADKIIAISEQTKEDLINYYRTPAEKIEVVYQSCDEMFAKTYSRDLLAKYNLPAEYFLYVGSIIERKNLLGIMKAMLQLKEQIDIPLVVLGNGSSYKKKVKEFIATHDLHNRVIFLNEQTKFAYNDLPVLYQGAKALIYPSIFEGFGIPILEALWSRIPVITSSGSCFKETGGDAAIYIDPLQPQMLAEAMKLITENPAYAQELTVKGWAHAQLFTQEKCAAGVIKVYDGFRK